MDTTILVALITAGGAVAAAVIAILPHLLKREKRPAEAPAPQTSGAFSDAPAARPPVAQGIRGEPAPGPAGGEPFVRISGTSASARGTPRELDLAPEGEEIVLHVHQPGGSQSKLWVGRTALQEALDQWGRATVRADRIEVTGRGARKETAVVFVFRDEGEVEVQAGWWIWVSGQELKAALHRLGLRAPW